MHIMKELESTEVEKEKMTISPSLPDRVNVC